MAQYTVARNMIEPQVRFYLSDYLSYITNPESCAHAHAAILRSTFCWLYCSYTHLPAHAVKEILETVKLC
jgi:hypothetical protein